MVMMRTIDEIQAAVANTPQLWVRAGGSKTALAGTNPDAVEFDLRELCGILEYDPGEYTFTALAGTPLRTVVAALAEHGQHLPFDPPLVDQGATLGGTVAAGLSGSGRYRFGGIRDFLIGVRFVDGQGRLVRGGGKVVKNAAGFDLPKLMVGSLGQFGILVELSFKVFPRPQSFMTLVTRHATLTPALAALQKLVDSHFDLYALDLAVVEDAPNPYQLRVRMGGLSNVLPRRMEQVRQRLGIEAVADSELLEAAEEQALWHAVSEFAWRREEQPLIKIATTPGKLASLDPLLAAATAQRHYTVGGNLTWITWPGELTTLDRELTTLGLAGVALLGNVHQPLLGKQRGHYFAQRVKNTLDPAARFPTVAPLVPSG